MTMKNDAKIELPVQNWHEEFDEFWSKHLQISRICTLLDCLWTMYIMLELKKYRGIMFNGTEDWFKIWRKTDLYFKIDMRNLGNFLQSIWKSRNRDFDRILLSKVRKYMNLKFTGELWPWKKMQNWKRNWLGASKLTWKLWWILT